MNTLDLVPRLPTRLDLVLWLVGGAGEENSPPGEFDISGGGCSEHLGDGLPPCPVAEYLRRRYVLKSVESDGWSLFVGHGHGITLAWDVDDSPALLGLTKAFAVLVDQGIRVVSRTELLDVLKGGENPHDVADRIKHTRSLAA